MMRQDWLEFIEWLIWMIIFGTIIAATLWIVLVNP